MAARPRNHSFVGAYVDKDKADALEAKLHEAGITIEEWVAAVVKDAIAPPGNSARRPGTSPSSPKPVKRRRTTPPA